MQARSYVNPQYAVVRQASPFKTYTSLLLLPGSVGIRKKPWIN